MQVQTLSLKQHAPQKNRKQKGFSMIELMLALVIIGMLSVPIYFIFKQASESAQTENEISNVNGIAASIRKAWRSSSDFSALTNAVLITRKAVPEKMDAGDGTNLINLWGGSVTVSATDPSGAAGQTAFQIAYTNVPASACLDFVSGVQSAFSTVNVAGTDIKTTATAYDQNTAVTQCSAAERVDINFIGQ